MTLLTALLLLQSQAAEPLQRDERLSKPITYSTYTTSVAKVLDHVKEATGVELRAQSAIAEELLVLRVKDRPAHEVLSRIASHFDWVWTTTDRGFILTPKPGWEAKQRQHLDNLVLQSMKETVKAEQEYLKSAARANKAAALAQVAEIDKRLEAIDAANADEDEYDESTYDKLRELWRERSELLKPLYPSTRLVAEIVTSLDAAELLNLAKRGRIVFSMQPTPAQKRMPRRAMQAAASLVQEVVSNTDRFVEQPDEFEWSLALASPATKPFKIEDVAAVRVALNADWAEIAKREAWVGYGEISILGKDGKVLWRDFEEFASDGPQMYDFPPDEWDVPEEQDLDPVGPVTELPQKLADYTELVQAITRRANPEMPSPLLVEALKKASQVDPLSVVNQIAVLIADAADCALIGDAYDTFPTHGKDLPGPTLGHVMDSFARWRDATWQHESGWVTIRSNRPELGRASTVPRSVLFKYRDWLADQLGLTADQLAQLTLDLTDLQLMSEHFRLFTTLFVPFLEVGLGSDTSTKYAYRAWASMGPDMRGALRSGADVTFGALPAAARAFLAEYLYRQGENWNTNGSFILDIFDTVETETDEDETETSFEADLPAEDREITQILPNGPSPDAIVSAEMFLRPGVSTRMTVFGMSFPMTLPASYFGEVRFMLEAGSVEIEVPPVSFEGFRPATADGAILTLTFLPEKSTSAAFFGMTAVPGTEFGNLGSLPKEITEIIDKAYARAKKRWGGSDGSLQRPQ